MRNQADDIPAWLASLSDRTLRRFSSRLCYVVRMVDVEIQRRELNARKCYSNDILPSGKAGGE